MLTGFLSSEMQDPAWVTGQNTSFSQEAYTNRSEAIDLLNSTVEEELAFEHRLRPEPIALAVWIAKAIGDNTLLSRLSIVIRDLYRDSLEKLNTDQMEEEASALGIALETVDRKNFRIFALDFVKNNAHLSGYKYRLAFQRLDHGWVIADRHVTVRIMRECLVTSIMQFQSGIDQKVAKDCLGEMSSFAKVVRDAWTEARGIHAFDLGAVNDALFPPCIKEYIVQMKNGVNLTHMARFTLTSFLRKIGMGNPDIMALFRTAPDFNERMTQYQVEHITGEISGTEYSPPKCVVLRSNHLCYWGEDKLCHQEWLRHPLQYYQIKKRNS